MGLWLRFRVHAIIYFKVYYLNSSLDFQAEDSKIMITLNDAIKLIQNPSPTVFFAWNDII